MFDVPIKNDRILEDDEDFRLSILSHSLPNRITQGDDDSSTVSIVDDDG